MEREVIFVDFGHIGAFVREEIPELIALQKNMAVVCKSSAFPKKRACGECVEKFLMQVTNDPRSWPRHR